VAHAPAAHFLRLYRKCPPDLAPSPALNPAAALPIKIWRDLAGKVAIRVRRELACMVDDGFD
jgi:hypothetical protein